MLHEPISIDGLQRALDNHALIYGQARLDMLSIRSKHPLTWWCRPSYWKAESVRTNQHRKVLVGRTKLVTAIKEKES